MAMTWMFLLVVFIALGMFAVVIGVMVMLCRAASKSAHRPPNGAGAGPAAVTDDSLTNPASPLHHLHHPTSTPDVQSRHHSADPGPGPSAFDTAPSSNPSVDAGSSSMSSDSGSNCG